jgi:hypothetical protein
MDLFTRLFGGLLAFVYHCFDRVIYGYLSGLSRPEWVVNFFHHVVGVPVVSREILSQRTADYQNWVEAFARNHRIPIECALVRGYTAGCGAGCVPRAKCDQGEVAWRGQHGWHGHPLDHRMGCVFCRSWYWKPMPYTFNESRRHKIPGAKYRVTNWPEYDAAPVKRGSLTVWFTQEAVAAWQAPATGKRGGSIRRWPSRRALLSA